MISWQFTSRDTRTKLQDLYLILVLAQGDDGWQHVEHHYSNWDGHDEDKHHIGDPRPGQPCPPSHEDNSSTLLLDKCKQLVYIVGKYNHCVYQQH